jgi:hypothetical protein
MSKDPPADTSADAPRKPLTAEEKQERKAQKALEGAAALNEYRDQEMATRDRTAKLREERLAREAADKAPPKKNDTP